MSTILLRTPIQAHGEERRQLTFREPKGADFQAGLNLPLRFGEGGTMSMDSAAVSAWISRLGEIPPSSVGQLTAVDWMEAMKAVMGFFDAMATPPEETSSEDISISPGSGNGRQPRSSR